MGKLKKLVTRLRHGSSGVNSNTETKNDNTCVKQHKQISRPTTSTKNDNKKNFNHEEMKSKSLKLNDNNPGPSSIIKKNPINIDNEKLNIKNKNIKSSTKKCEMKKCKGKEMLTDADKLHRLIIKVKDLKKTIDDYETVNNTENGINDIVKRVGITQTSGKYVNDNHDALITLSHCKIQLMRLEEFFKDENCKKIITELNNHICCNIESLHFHTYIDCLPSVISFSIENEKQKIAIPSTSKDCNETLKNKNIKINEKLDNLHSDVKPIGSDEYFGKATVNILKDVSRQSETFLSLNAPRLKSKTIKSETSHN